MKKLLAVFVAVCFAVPCMMLTAQAEEEMDYAYGEVISVTQDQIVISEYDETVDDYGNVTYILGPSVTFKNAGSFKDIPVGADVEINFVAKDGKNAAMIVTLEEEEEEGEGVVVEEEDVIEVEEE